MHVSIRDWCAEEVIRVHSEANLFANGSKFLRTFDGDFEFRLFVFLNFEITAGFRFADRRGDVVATKRRFVSDIQFAAERAARGKW